MNKFFDVFGKKKNESLKTRTCVKENINNNPFSPKFVFKFHQFDSDCCGTGEAEQSSCYSVSAPQKIIRGDIVHSYSKSSAHAQDPPAPFVLEAEKNNFSISEEVGSLSTQSSFPFVQCQKQSFLDRKNKSKKNICVIQISNSKRFHIGPQTTINICGQQSLRDSTRSMELPCTEDASPGSEMDFSKLLDCEQKLNENFITKVSSHVGKKWKKFGRNLGLEDSFLEEQEFQNDANGALIVYDMLQYYVSQFPNTSLGFVIYVLSEIHQNQLIQQLATKETENFFG